MPPSKSKPKRIVNISTLPGEPTDGSGKVCIHLFVQDEERGSFVEPHVLHMELGNQLVSRPTRGRIVCDPNLVPTGPQTLRQGGKVINVLLRTDDARAVTCPKCIATDDYKKRMALFTKGG